jgi:hypothetical protein
VSRGKGGGCAFLGGQQKGDVICAGEEPRGTVELIASSRVSCYANSGDLL